MLIIVCDNTDIAEVFYRKICGEIEEDVVTEAEVAEVLGEEENGDVDAGGNGTPKKAKGAKRKKNVIYGQGAIFPELFFQHADRKAHDPHRHETARGGRERRSEEKEAGLRRGIASGGGDGGQARRAW